MKELLKLFSIFFRIGAFTFGGGYVMIPIIQHEISEKEKLMSEEDVSELLVIAQSLPGMMAVNAATSIGYRLKGIRGAIACAFGVALPSFLIIVILASLILKYQSNPYLMGAFHSVRAVVVGMVIAAAVKMGKKCWKNPAQMAIMAIALILAVVGVHPFLLILAGALAGWLLSSHAADTSKGGGKA